MREIVGARAVIDGKAAVDLGGPGARPLPPSDPADQSVGDFTARLTMPFFCPILPDTPIARGIDDPAGSGPYYVAERIPNQRIVLKRNPFYRGERPANVDQVVWTIGDSPEACLPAVEQDRIDHCVNTVSASLPRRTEVWPRSTASTGQTGSCSSGRGCGRGSTPSTMTAPRSRAPARSRSRRRSTSRSTGRRCTRPAATWQASEPTRCSRPPSPADERLPARRTEPRSGAALVCQGTLQADRRLSSTRRTTPSPSRRPVARVRPEAARVSTSR